jgi:polar amino acid transport system substrate-binding protein
MAWLLRLLFVVLTGSAAAWADEIVVGLRAVAPYVVVSPTGAVSGLEYDIIREALAARGHVLRPVLLPLARLVATFRDGGVAAAAPILASHQSGGYLSHSYLTYHNVVMSLASTPLALKSVQDLQGLSLVAFQTARTVLGPEFAAAVAGNPRYREEAQQVTQIRLLFSGRVQAVVGEQKILQALIAAPGSGVDATQATTVYPLFPPTQYCVAFHDAQQAADFDAGLDAIRADGTYARLLARYR